ncbi:MAG: sensor histidine kinase [Hyphomicrobiales bacterium]|nr:MAG: sensor histidine kinase [Hyphomicrobiales bacterium]
MKFPRPRSAALMAALLLGAIGLAWAGLGLVDRYFLTTELAASARRAAPYLTSLISVMERYQNLPAILSEDEQIIRAAEGTATPAISQRLARYAATTRAEAIYLMDPDGLTIAASNWDRPQTFLGQNYGFRPYFKAAMAGHPGEFFAIGATTGKPGYFVSHPVRGQTGTIIGVIAAKVDLQPLEADWQSPEGRIFIANADGVIVLAQDNGWRYRTLRALGPPVRAAIARRRQFGGKRLEPLGLARDGRLVTIGATRYIEHTQDIGRLGWKLYLLSPYENIQERRLLVIAIAAVVLSLLLALMLFRRSERTRNLLISSQKERDVLNRLNRDLAREIEERNQAEKRLQLAQKELRQSSKLAALGQLAASVNHELGQPLAAMKTYIAGGLLPRSPADEGRETDSEQTALLGQLDRLVDRMSETTRQLRFFARRGGEAFADVDLADVIAGALETMRPAIQAEGVALNCPDAGRHVLVRGGRMRLEQVLVNLIRNALDAMRSVADKQLTIRLESDEQAARIVVRDSGEGLCGDHRRQIFEPFVTTKASGEGLGLGLAISASIVKEHDGRLSARNIEGGGAEFMLELQLKEPDAA